MASEDDVSSSSSRGGTPERTRRDILTPAITSVVTALGGAKDGTYVLGDDVYGCLKDLKKFWRKDDTDDERTVARIFWEARVLQNDLVPILLETAGKGNVEDRCAIACADLITAMTWPIDVASELMELDEELDVGTDYTALLNSHLSYKAALLQPGVLQALFGIILPCLAKTKKERKDRDGQIVNVVLHLFRNLAFIRDLPPNTHLSADQAEYSALQSKLITTLSDAHIFDLLLTLATNTEQDALFTSWNTLLLEIFYLLFRGVKPSYLVQDRAQAPKSDLKKLLDSEDTRKRTYQRTAASRHSRFGTTISIKAGDDSMVLHRQEAITREAREIVDGTKKKRHQKAKTLDALGTQDNLGQEALTALQGLARGFITSCFNSFLASLLKDIKSERAKITEKDNLRLLFVAKWFLEFFLSGISSLSAQWGWTFEMVAEVIERGWIVWVLRRMRGALDEKPKQWTELQAGIECLTQLLLLIDCMSLAPDPTLSDAAETLQHQLYYNGEVLDLAFEGLQNFKEQSIAYLDSSIHLAYILLRMLEKWGKKKGDVYVRRRRTRAKNRGKRKGKGAPEEEGVLDVADVEDEVDGGEENMIEEQMFTFDKFEAKFAHEDITRTLLTYLSRFREFDNPENMKRVVGLLHRQAVKAKAEGLFFKVSTLDLFKSILAEQKSLPRTQPYKDLLQLINYIVRQFFKATEKEPFLVVEAFFPKNRGQWKNFSSWEPEKKDRKSSKTLDDTPWKHPQDVQVKKGYSWSEQLGIAIACLVDDGRRDLVDWVIETLTMVIGSRQRIVEETDGPDKDKNSGEDQEMDEDERIRKEATRLKGPSADAIAKFEDYLIPYLSDEHADAATKNPQFKLVCRLVKFYVLDDNADELEWYVPAAILPSELQTSLNVIMQFLETPLDLGGKKAAQLLGKKTRRRAKRKTRSSDTESEVGDADDDEQPKRKERKKTEQTKYKSAQFIDDSDAMLEDDEEFFAKEAATRSKTSMAAGSNRPGTMRATGTKKRKKRKEGEGNQKKKRKSKSVDISQSAPRSDGDDSDADGQVEAPQVGRGSSPSHSTTPEGSSKPRPRPRPRPAFQNANESSPGDPFSAGEGEPVVAAEEAVPKPRPRPRPAFKETLPLRDEIIENAGGDTVRAPTRRKAGKVIVSDEDEE